MKSRIEVIAKKGLNPNLALLNHEIVKQHTIHADYIKNFDKKKKELASKILSEQEKKKINVELDALTKQEFEFKQSHSDIDKLIKKVSSESPVSLTMEKELRAADTEYGAQLKKIDALHKSNMSHLEPKLNASKKNLDTLSKKSTEINDKLTPLKAKLDDANRIIALHTLIEGYAETDKNNLKEYNKIKIECAKLDLDIVKSKKGLQEDKLAFASNSRLVEKDIANAAQIENSLEFQKSVQNVELIEQKYGSIVTDSKVCNARHSSYKYMLSINNEIDGILQKMNPLKDENNQLSADIIMYNSILRDADTIAKITADSKYIA
jgi:chromosome segregation ATPase